jgi:hypothetical protein
MSKVKGIKVGSADITGTYNSTSTLSDTEHLEVVKVPLGNIASPNDTTYTGSAQYPTPTVTATVDGESVVLVKDTDYTLSYTNNTNAGTATVTATGINNYSGTVSSTWTINPAEIIVDADNQSYVYTKSPQGLGISVSCVGDNSGNITIEYGIGSNTYTTSTTPQITNVSESTTIYYRVTIPNHTTKTGSYTLEITPVTATLVWGTLSWVYDGEEHSTTCVVGNLIGNDVCTVYLSGNSITAGDPVTVTATGLSNSNYELPNDVTRVLTITAGLFVKLSGLWTPVKKVYKKINGEWVQQEFNTAFNPTLMYKKIN